MFNWFLDAEQQGRIFCSQFAEGKCERSAQLTNHSKRKMSSSSPEPVSVKVKRQKTKTKSKGKGKAREISPRNEGEDPHWDYEPLPGFSPLENVVDTEEFEWDAMNNDDDCELWLIRVPEGVR